MNILSVIKRYEEIKQMSPEERKAVVPRVVIIGGKAASAYDMAKRIVALANAVSKKVNNDPEVGDLLKLYFLPDYNVSLAEVLIPGVDKFLLPTWDYISFLGKGWVELCTFEALQDMMCRLLMPINLQGPISCMIYAHI